MLHTAFASPDTGSVVIDVSSVPESIGKPKYEADQKTCVLKVKLEPGKTCGYWLNSQNFHGFRDKVLGFGFLDNKLPFATHILLVSGRASFEILQKSLAAGIPVVCAVSAPSSLAVDFARESGKTLVGFLRGETMNIYTGAERILPSGPKPKTQSSRDAQAAAATIPCGSSTNLRAAPLSKSL